jgi:N-acetylmuramoyl-L-alanine amidase
MRTLASLLIGITVVLSACAEKQQQHYQRIVVIDPGHGGRDPGAIGSTGYVLEKNVALRIGLALRDRLEATGRYQVAMTRDDDRFVRLHERLQIARQSQGELFISLHADSLVSVPEVNGAAVYAPLEPAFDGSARLASEENGAGILTGMDLANQDGIASEMLLDLAQPTANERSIALADLLVWELSGATRMLRRRPVQAGFIVLRSPVMPSVLVEVGYLSNPADERALTSDAHIAGLATAMARAVDAYFGAGPVSFERAGRSMR